MSGLLNLSLLLLCLLLGACASFQEPVLEIGAGQLRLDSQFPVKELSISNVGSRLSKLRWSASSDSALIHISPAEGELRGGQGSELLRISVDFSDLEEGDVSSASVTIESNGGDVVLPVSFHMTAERACSPDMEAQYEFHSLSTSAPPAGSFVPGELLVGYAEPAGEYEPLSAAAARREQASDVRSEHGLRLLSVGSSRSYERVAAREPLEAARRLRSDPRVAFAHPNYYVRPLGIPNDPCYFDQWNVHGFGLEEAWEYTGMASGAPVVVAVIDTGVDTDHEDLRDKLVPGYDIWDDDEDPSPGGPAHASAHGTHVAGIALAEGDNGVGVAGVAYGPNVKLLPVKIFDDSGSLATTADLADAILWAAGIPVSGLPTNHYPADVINMSVGAGPGRVAVLDEATARAREAGAVLLAAAGNNTSTEGQYGVQAPANSPAVIAVGSVNESLTRSSFSDWGADGASVDLMAPGGYGSSSCLRIRSTIPWNDYGCMAGTSMAAPFASGVAALILAQDPDLEPAEVERRLIATAYFDPSMMNRDEYGSGVICAVRALAGIFDRRAQPCD